VYSDSRLPDAYEGLLVANELLDALPVHQVVMRADGLREVFVQAKGDRLITVEDAPSTPALADYLKAVDISLECGWRVEIGLQAVEWIREAARRLQRGFLVLVDYGHQARELYAPGHEGGTLTTFFRHASTDADPNDCTPEWLRSPGDQDITAHVDFTSARAAAEAEGLVTLALLDQTYFLMGLANLDAGEAAVSLTDVRRRRAFQTLIMPGGLGSTMKVLISARNVGTPALRGCSYKVRAT
jgi:SAM-dependent MidA family methyltransferase